jgi:D-alanyl-D-alanine dipeptidase
MSKTRPHDILSIHEHDPSIIVDLAYATKNNFTGAVVPGYSSNIGYIQENVLKQLSKINSELLTDDLCLYIFDSYRPANSVSFFHTCWRLKEDNSFLKHKYYPTLTKEELFKYELLAIHSSHSRASTVDLGIYDLKCNKLVDMGSIFDYFHEISITDTKLITPEAQKNRLILKGIMEENGFINYKKEWWHYRFKDEKYPTTYFDFDIES